MKDIHVERIAPVTPAVPLERVLAAARCGNPSCGRHARWFHSYTLNGEVCDGLYCDSCAEDERVIPFLRGETDVVWVRIPVPEGR